MEARLRNILSPWPTSAARARILAIVALLLVVASSLRAAERPAAKQPSLVTPATQKAIDKGLAWLAARQNDDGTYGTGPMRTNVAIAGLSGMAFLGGGSTPHRGPYGEHVSRSVDYVLTNAQQSGFINEPGAATSQGPMYGHGFATMFLAECYGMSPRPELRDKLSKAIKLIVNTQNKEGGWRYQPERVAAADISVTVCEVMALRAARNAGLFVPNETIERAKKYIISSQNADGGFAYMLQGPRESGFPRSAAAVVALYSAGTYKGEEINKGLDYLFQFLPAAGANRGETYYEYGHYYAVQAMWQAGGERWSRWYPAVRDEMLGRQQPDGSWQSPISNEYATAMCTIVLQMPGNQVPIFQR
jgi:hypothetical protein